MLGCLSCLLSSALMQRERDVLLGHLLPEHAGAAVGVVNLLLTWRPLCPASRQPPRMTDSLDLMGKTSNTTAEQCYNSQSTVLEGQPFGGIPTVLIINIFLWLVSSGHCGKQVVRLQPGQMVQTCTNDAVVAVVQTATRCW